MRGHRRVIRSGLRNGGSVSAFNPTKLSGLELWLRADLGITLNVGNVSQWNDQSGKGDANRNHAQGTAANQPLYNTTDAGYGGRSTITFDNANDGLQSGNWSVAPPQTGTLFIVGNSDGAATNRNFFGDKGALQYCLYQDAGAGMMYFQSAGLALGGDSTSKHVFGIDMNGATTKIFRDQVTANVTGNSGAVAIAATTVGALTATTFPLNGKIAEVIVYSTRLAAADFNQVMNYLGARYGVTIGP